MNNPADQTNPFANAAPSSESGGLMPVDGQSDHGTGGVFRLEAMAPGVENAEKVLSATRKRKISTQAIALGTLLFLGGGMIYGMRLLGIGPLTTLAKWSPPDYDLNRSTGSSTGADQKKILQDLAANHAASQVPVDEVQKNPFRMSDVVGAPSGPIGDPNAAGRIAAERARRDAELRRGKIQSTLAQLKINGIIDGSSPVARISGDAVRIGDTIGDPPVFRVKAIHGRSVELELASTTPGQANEVFEISMDDEASNSNKKKK